MNPFKDIVIQYGEHSDRPYILHWKNRFDPGTLAIAAMVAGTGMKAYGQYQEGQAADEAAKYNQKVLEREAQAREQKALFDSRRQAEESARRTSSMRASMGASGTLTTEGSPLQILSVQAEQDEMDNMLIGYNSMTEAQALRSKGEMERWKGKQAKSASRIAAGTTLLTGFSDIALMGGFGGKTDWMKKPASKMTESQKTTMATINRY